MLGVFKRCWNYFENENHSLIMIFYFFVSPFLYSIYFKFGLLKHFEIIGIYNFIFINFVTLFGWYCYVKVNFV